MTVHYSGEELLQNGYIYRKAPQQVCELQFNTKALQILPSADKQAAMLICPLCHTDVASHRRWHCLALRDFLHKYPNWSGAIPL